MGSSWRFAEAFDILVIQLYQPHLIVSVAAHAATMSDESF
jgi:hypothetical protein